MKLHRIIFGRYGSHRLVSSCYIHLLVRFFFRCCCLSIIISLFLFQCFMLVAFKNKPTKWFRAQFQRITRTHKHCTFSRMNIACIESNNDDSMNVEQCGTVIDVPEYTAKENLIMLCTGPFLENFLAFTSMTLSKWSHMMCTQTETDVLIVCLLSTCLILLFHFKQNTT